MLSEDLQDVVGGDQPAQTCVPHGTQVLAGGFLNASGEAVVGPHDVSFGGQ